MAVSTLFLQTTQDETNAYADTTFYLDVPMQLPTYKLSVASFFFRPKLVLSEQEYIKVRLRTGRNQNALILAPFVNDWMILPDGEPGVWEGYDIFVTVPLTNIEFNPGFDIENLDNMLNKQVQFRLRHYQRDWQQVTSMEDVPKSNETENVYSCEVGEGKVYYYKVPIENGQEKEKYKDYTVSVEMLTDIVENNKLLVGVNMNLTWDVPDTCNWQITEFEILEVSPVFSRLTGITPSGLFTRDHVNRDDKSVVNVLSYVTTKIFHPQYFNYMTLTCNKVYNTASIVNQTEYNTAISDSSKFYQSQVMGYMVNTCASTNVISVGMPTANEYLINPSDFNSIRFTLHYDNGDPVKLHSPMTIVLNVMPI